MSDSDFDDKEKGSNSNMQAETKIELMLIYFFLFIIKNKGVNNAETLCVSMDRRIKKDFLKKPALIIVSDIKYINIECARYCL